MSSESTSETQQAEQASLTRSATVTISVGPPPAYDGNPASGENSEEEAQAPVSPPSYETASKLPTYDEAEKLKANEAGVPLQPPCPDRLARENRRNRSGLFFWAAPGLLFDASRRGNVDTSNITHAQLQQQVLGTELEFLCCFLIAFLFNWIGLFAALCCLTVTISGRAGAISGFGLSVIKWAFLVMHQTYITQGALNLYGDVTESNTTDNPLDWMSVDRSGRALTNTRWFTASCWLIVALGFLCFLQGIVHYARAKRYARDPNWLRQRYTANNPF